MKVFHLATALVLSALPAGAATLSVDLLPTGFTTDLTASVPEATFTSSGTGFYFNGASYEPDSFCAVSGYTCEADLEIAFTAPVSELSFYASGYNWGDYVLLSVFDSATLLGIVEIAGDRFVDLTAFASITRLFFDDSSTGAGFGYSGFSFLQGDVPPPLSPVPLPASLPLLAAALAGVAALRRRKA